MKDDFYHIRVEVEAGLKPHEIEKIKSEYDKLIQKYGARYFLLHE